METVEAGKMTEKNRTFGGTLSWYHSRSLSFRWVLRWVCPSPYLAGTLLLGLLFSSFTVAGEVAPITVAPGSRPPASAFYRLPQFAQPRLSPSGRYLSARVVTNGKLGLLVKPLKGDEEPYLLDSGDRWTIRNTLWVSDHEILIGFSRPYSLHGTAVMMTQAMQLNMKTRKARTLFQRETGFGFLQLQNRFLGRIPERPGAFLLEGATGENPKNTSVYAVSGTPSKLPVRAVQTTQKDVFNWQADRLGNVRVGHGFTPNQQRGVLKLKDAQGDWHDVSALLDREALVLALPTRDLNVYLILMLPKDSADGTSLRHVYSYDASTGTEQLVYKANHSEVASVLMDLKGEDVVLVKYQDETLPPVIFHPLLKEIYEALSAHFEDGLIFLYDVSDDLSSALFGVNSPSVPGALYLYNAEARELQGVSIQYPGLEGSALGEVYPVEYQARDGLKLPAYLTLPNGLSPDTARGLPFVVLPHGNPHARDFRRFDWVTQMLANEGYGVLQMNFRGSTGYGTALEKAGRQQWGQVMLDDITDGAHWLVEEKIAAADRICIVGEAFGGYAALMSAVKSPELYRCAAGLNAVGDLFSLVAEGRKYVGGFFYRRHVGRLWQRPHLLANAPRPHADKVQVPVLLAVSEKNRIVNPRQTRRLYKALQKAKKDVELVELPGGDHALSRQDNRKAFSEALLSFLSEHLDMAGSTAAGG